MPGDRKETPDGAEKRLRILGIRGLPASYGGFETFAQDLALHLTDRGWKITVYCQDDGGSKGREEIWRGIHLVHIPVMLKKAAGSISFDWKSTLHASRAGELVLTLGYNTAVFYVVHRFRRIRNVVNIGGTDWKRKKWPLLIRFWFYVNYVIGCRLGDHLVSDHPRMTDLILKHAPAAKITMIPYGADRVVDADPRLLDRFGLTPRRFVLVIARSEPGHSLVDVVSAFSRKPRGLKLVVVGPYDPERNRFHELVMSKAGPEVMFVGAVFERAVIQSLRVHARLYVHGHHHGGTNPGLVEALGAGSAVLANDNPFNRWVAGEKTRFFSNVDDCAAAFDALLDDEPALREMRASSVQRFEDEFTQQRVLGAYERLLTAWLAAEEP